MSLPTLAKSFGYAGPLKIIAIGPKGGKIVGYGAGHKPIYAGSAEANKLALLHALKDEPAPTKPKTQSLLEKWLAALGVTFKAHPQGMAVDAEHAHLFEGLPPVEKTDSYSVFTLAQLLPLAGKPLTPPPHKEAAVLAAAAAGDLGEQIAPPASELTATGKKLGTHGGMLLQDKSGGKFVFKPNGGFKAPSEAEVAARRIARLVLPKALFGQVAPSAMMEFGGKTGVVIPWVEGKGIGNHEEFFQKYFDDLVQNHLVDWLTANHDTHSGNFLVQPNGKMGVLDKGQAFKHIGEDKLNGSYKPSENPDPSLYDEFWKVYKTGKLVGDPVQSSLPVFEKLAAISPEQYRQILQPYLDAVAKESGESKSKQVAAAAMARFADLRSNWEGWLSQQTGKPVSLEVAPPPVVETPKVPETPAEPAPTKATPVTGWPQTKGLVTVLHPGTPSPGPAWGGYPGPGYKAKIKYKGNEYTVEFLPGEKLNGVVTLPDGTTQPFLGVTHASNLVLQYHKKIPFTTTAAEMKAMKIAYPPTLLFKFSEFDFKSAGGATPAPSAQTVQELEKDKVVRPEQAGVTKTSLIKVTPSGYLTDLSAFPESLQAFAQKGLMPADQLPTLPVDFVGVLPGKVFKGYDPVNNAHFVVATSSSGTSRKWTFPANVSNPDVFGPGVENVFASPQWLAEKAKNCPEFSAALAETDAALKAAHAPKKVKVKQPKPLPAGYTFAAAISGPHIKSAKGEIQPDGSVTLSINQTQVHAALGLDPDDATSGYNVSKHKSLTSAAAFIQKLNGASGKVDGWKFFDITPELEEVELDAPGLPPVVAEPAPAPTPPPPALAPTPLAPLAESTPPSKYPTITVVAATAVTQLTAAAPGSTLSVPGEPLFVKNASGDWVAQVPMQYPVTTTVLSSLMVGKPGVLMPSDNPTPPAQASIAAAPPPLKTVTTLEDIPKKHQGTVQLLWNFLKKHPDDAKKPSGWPAYIPPPGTVFEVTSTGGNKITVVVQAGAATDGNPSFNSFGDFLPFKSHATVEQLNLYVLGHEAAKNAGPDALFQGQLYAPGSVFTPSMPPTEAQVTAGVHPQDVPASEQSKVVTAHADYEALIASSETEKKYGAKFQLSSFQKNKPFTSVMVVPHDAKGSAKTIMDAFLADHPALGPHIKEAEEWDNEGCKEGCIILKSEALALPVVAQVTLAETAAISPKPVSQKLQKVLDVGTIVEISKVLEQAPQNSMLLALKQGKMVPFLKGPGAWVPLWSNVTGLSPDDDMVLPAPAEHGLSVVGSSLPAVLFNPKLKTYAVFTGKKDADGDPIWEAANGDTAQGWELTKEKSWEAVQNPLHTWEPPAAEVPTTLDPNESSESLQEKLKLLPVGATITGKKLVLTKKVHSSGKTGWGWDDPQAGSLWLDDVASAASVIMTQPEGLLSVKLPAAPPPAPEPAKSAPAPESPPLPAKVLKSASTETKHNMLAKMPDGTKLTQKTGEVWTKVGMNWDGGGNQLSHWGMSHFIHKHGTVTVTPPGKVPPPAPKPQPPAAPPPAAVKPALPDPELQAKIKKAQEYVAWLKDYPQPVSSKQKATIAKIAHVTGVNPLYAYVDPESKGLLLGKPDGTPLEIPGVASAGIHSAPHAQLAKFPADLLKSFEPAPEVTGPDGVNYPAGTTFTESKVPADTKQSVLAKAVVKITEHQSDPDLMVVKFKEGTPPADVKLVLDGLGLPVQPLVPGKPAEVVTGSVYVLAAVKKAELQQATSFTTKVTPEIPPQLPPAVLASPALPFGQQQQGHAFTPNSHELDMVPALKPSVWGHHVALGSMAWEGHAVRVMRVKDATGAEFFEVHGGLLDTFNPQKVKGATKAVDAYQLPLHMLTAEGHPQFKDGVHSHAAGAYTKKVTGYQGSTPAGTRFAIAAASGEKAYDGQFVARIPVNADVRTELATALQALGFDPAKALQTFGPDEERLAKKAAVVRALQGCKGYRDMRDNGVASTYANEAWLDQQLQELGAKEGVDAKQLVTNAKLVTGAGNQIRIELDDVTDSVIQKNDIGYVTMGFSSALNQEAQFNLVHYALTSGCFTSRLQGHQTGTGAGGASASSDENGGGAKGLFTRLQRNGLSGVGNVDGSEVYRIFWHPRVLNRADWWANNGDGFGKVHDSDSVDSRKKSLQLSTNSNEILWPGGIDTTACAGIACETEAHRQKMLVALKKAGLTEVAGIPLEDFLVTLSTTASPATVKKKLKGLGGGV